MILLFHFFFLSMYYLFCSNQLHSPNIVHIIFNRTTTFEEIRAVQEKTMRKKRKFIHNNVKYGMVLEISIV